MSCSALCRRIILIDTKNIDLMKNKCTNWFDFRSGNTGNLNRIKSYLDERFGVYGMVEEDDRIRGAFDSQRYFPEQEIITLIRSLESDPDMIVRIVSFQPEEGYLQARIIQGGEWNVIP